MRRRRKKILEICSFCGKSSNEVDRMVASNISESYICGDCIMKLFGK
ncbi:MAG: ClpX C4-type zinc finger protein [Gammaproteobacteria bacterium]